MNTFKNLMLHVVDAYSDDHSEDRVMIEIKTRNGWCYFPIELYVETELCFDPDMIEPAMSVGKLDLTSYLNEEVEE